MIFKSKNFSQSKNISHAFFSRKKGKSKGIYSSLNCGLGSKDNKKNVYQNLEIVKKKIAIKFLFLVNQKHSNKIIVLKKLPTNTNQPRIGSGDGIFTNLSNVSIGILTADCAPVLFVDKKSNYICCVHAGWKGAFGNIVENAIALFKKNKVGPKDLKVCIGPCIAQKSYEVKIDFYSKFLSKNPEYRKCFLLKNNKIFFNLRYFIKLKLLKAKVLKTNISHINRDTFSHESSFYSYRRSVVRSEKDYGRNLSLIAKYN